MLNELAAAVPVILEDLLNPIDRWPVVHRVNHELAGDQGRVERRKPVDRDRQHDDIGAVDGIGGPSWLAGQRSAPVQSALRAGTTHRSSRKALTSLAAWLRGEVVLGDVVGKRVSRGVFDQSIPASVIRAGRPRIRQWTVRVVRASWAASS